MSDPIPGAWLFRVLNDGGTCYLLWMADINTDPKDENVMNDAELLAKFSMPKPPPKFKLNTLSSRRVGLGSQCNQSNKKNLYGAWSSFVKECVRQTGALQILKTPSGEPSEEVRCALHVKTPTKETVITSAGIDSWLDMPEIAKIGTIQYVACGPDISPNLKNVETMVDKVFTIEAEQWGNYKKI